METNSRLRHPWVVGFASGFQRFQALGDISSERFLQQIEHCMERVLSEYEMMVMKDRYDENITLDALAKKYGKSREGIRLIIASCHRRVWKVVERDIVRQKLSMMPLADIDIDVLFPVSGFGSFHRIIRSWGIQSVEELVSADARTLAGMKLEEPDMFRTIGSRAEEAGLIIMNYEQAAALPNIEDLKSLPPGLSFQMSMKREIILLSEFVERIKTYDRLLALQGIGPLRAIKIAIELARYGYVLENTPEAVMAKIQEYREKPKDETVPAAKSNFQSLKAIASKGQMAEFLMKNGLFANKENAMAWLDAKTEGESRT